MPRTFLGDEVADKARWGEAFDLITKAARQSAPTTSGMPVLRVVGTMPPGEWCGVPRPKETDGRFALRIEIDPRATGEDAGCPLTIDLYRVEGVIDLVVVYGPKSVDGDEAVTARE